MSDLISRQAVENITWEEPSYTDPLNVLTEIREKVRALPSVANDGEWVLDYRDCGVEFYHCSKCNLGRAVIDGDYYKSLDEFKKCPNCGADMRGE